LSGLVNKKNRKKRRREERKEKKKGEREKRKERKKRRGRKKERREEGGKKRKKENKRREKRKKKRRKEKKEKKERKKEEKTNQGGRHDRPSPPEGRLSPKGPPRSPEGLGPERIVPHRTQNPCGSESWEDKTGAPFFSEISDFLGFFLTSAVLWLFFFHFLLPLEL